MAKKPQEIKGTERAFGIFQTASELKKKVQEIPSAEEIAQRKAENKTQGRAGCYRDRINMAFTVENYEFIKRFAKLRGENMTEFVNHIIDMYRGAHEQLIKEFEEFIEKT